MNEKIEIDNLPEKTSLKDYAHFKAKVTHGQNGELFLKGNISSTVKFECVICLKDFEENYNIDVSDTKEIARDILLSNISPCPVCAKCNLAK